MATTAKKKGEGTATRYKFDPKMCEELIEMGKTGASQKMMFAHIGISSGAAQTFRKNHPEFADALDMAITHAQAYWEREILANVNNKAFNSRLVEIALRGQFKGDYGDDRNQKVDLKATVEVDFGSAVTDLITALKKAS
jgi:hypothetical protein